jgi:hypothetical protein
LKTKERKDGVARCSKKEHTHRGTPHDTTRHHTHDGKQNDEDEAKKTKTKPRV